MMRSLYSGVSGLQNHQTRMDVVGNNIANINTTGFKKNRVNFQDMLYQQLSGASRPTEEVGGVNPKEVGLGMSVASIDTLHTQGSFQTTGVQTDLAIKGQGFFVLAEGTNQVYTRAGAFGLDNEGTLVNPSNGMKVQGWMAETINGEQVLNVSRNVGDLTIPMGAKDPARATGRVLYACNLDKRTVAFDPEAASALERERGTWVTQTKIYDSFGNEHIMQASLRRDNTDADGDGALDNPNTWVATVLVDPVLDPVTGEYTNPNNTVVAVGAEAGAPAADGNNTFTVTFDNNGTIVQAADPAGGVSGGAAGTQIEVNVAFSVPETEDGAGGLVPQNVVLDLGQFGGTTRALTQFAESSSSKGVEQDGYTMGYLENFKIDQSGVITGVYSNGTNRTLAQVALATFANQGGLEKNGDTAFLVSNNSGTANIGPSGVAGKGKIIAGTLEMSNVDMAGEFTDMIVTQRGFQANSRTIQTADQLLQELLTLKR